MNPCEYDGVVCGATLATICSKLKVFHTAGKKSNVCLIKAGLMRPMCITTTWQKWILPGRLFKEHIVANRLFTLLINIVNFRPAGQSLKYVRNTDCRVREILRPSRRRTILLVAVPTCRKDTFRKMKYSDAFREKMLRETELYLTAGLQAERREANEGLNSSRWLWKLTMHGSSGQF